MCPLDFARINTQILLSSFVLVILVLALRVAKLQAKIGQESVSVAIGCYTAKTRNAMNMITYEQRLSQDRLWALREGSMHFENESAVHKALNQLVCRLEELDIPYAVVGGMALYFHGLRRFTEDVDILVTPNGLRRLHEALDGLEYVPLFPGSKNLRDVASGVKIEFLVTGDFPGDDKPKPVSFPDPQNVATLIDGMRFLELPKLIELKLV